MLKFSTVPKFQRFNLVNNFVLLILQYCALAYLQGQHFLSKIVINKTNQKPQ